ncbi:NAD-dependent epimerase/dehydratase family protein [Flavobacterium sp. J49]|uniref:NAD-dependent epimerase/dehydratase family protein n=1 Tax=Flavobacterium sp. J49 TaxID=2718534 RepID=UPI001592D54E|nr:NAD-dependent epimerase/dehydratase family protein [Flavobacterium sp. J49]MBF6640019.1 NAD-dependent epimerase/dehydratase family protein [Flavobacterium sp. J49]NIC01264.1 NAD-dependent epimerase/dehydratase family protein [Flavobacterium sp. J49]
MKILITGSAGFIGMHTAQKLAQAGHEVVGLDNINSYYETQLKFNRLLQLGIEKEDIQYNKKLKGQDHFTFIELDIQDAGNLSALFAFEKFDCVIHLAAQAGVRYSITNPRDYIDSNIIGFFNILESCRQFNTPHLVFASSSSVYGNSTAVPFSESQNTDEPVSFYAATKKSNEVMAHAYADLYKIKVTGLRFFTVYGPWGRPDMAPMLFAKAGVEQKPIKIFNNGNQSRDFTYVDDIAEGIKIVVEDQTSTVNYQILNIGKGNPDLLMDFISILEKALQVEFVYDFKPAQKGDVVTTFANTKALEQLGYKPKVSLEDGIPKFVAWFKEYYKL